MSNPPTLHGSIVIKSGVSPLAAEETSGNNITIKLTNIGMMHTKDFTFSDWKVNGSDESTLNGTYTFKEDTPDPNPMFGIGASYSGYLPVSGVLNEGDACSFTLNFERGESQESLAIDPSQVEVSG